MATTKKALLIEYELEFLESKLDELKQYIEANPFSTLDDRMAWKETKGGGTSGGETIRDECAILLQRRAANHGSIFASTVRESQATSAVWRLRARVAVYRAVVRVARRVQDRG